MNIKVPQLVKSDFDGFYSLIKLLNQLQLSLDNELVIDFENTKVFEANLSAILGAIIDTALEQKKNVKLSKINDQIKDVFILNDFIDTPNNGLKTDHLGTVITYRKFTPYKDIEFMEYIKNEMLSKPDFPRHSKMLGKKINESIFELFENARTHGHCKNIYTCGQIFQDDKITRLDFTIVDMGNTIKTNVNGYLNQELSGSEAIEWAMEFGHTTKTGNVSGGIGLDIIFEFIQLNKGKIQIVSSDGYWEFFSEKKVKNLFDKPFPGTIANIEFNLNDKNSYLLKEEISLEDIF